MRKLCILSRSRAAGQTPTYCVCAPCVGDCSNDKHCPDTDAHGAHTGQRKSTDTYLHCMYDRCHCEHKGPCTNAHLLTQVKGNGADTYLHRVGRAGRFGTKGLAITFVASEKDSEVLNQVRTSVIRTLLVIIIIDSPFQQHVTTVQVHLGRDVEKFDLNLV